MMNQNELNSLAVKAVSVFDSLKRPVKVINKKDMPGKSIYEKVVSKLMSYHSTQVFYVKNIAIDKKMKLLDFNFQTLLEEMKKEVLKNKSKVVDYQELLVKKVTIEWVPYISPGMAGQTTILLCDLRSSMIENIVKGGFVFQTSKKIRELSISPGYIVNVNDPMLNLIFRFVVFTTNLDLCDSALHGHLSLRVKFELGASFNSVGNPFNELILVTNDEVIPLAQRESSLIDSDEVLSIEEVFSEISEKDLVKAEEILSDVKSLDFVLNSVNKDQGTKPRRSLSDLRDLRHTKSERQRGSTSSIDSDPGYESDLTERKKNLRKKKEMLKKLEEKELLREEKEVERRIKNLKMIEEDELLKEEKEIERKIKNQKMKEEKKEYILSDSMLAQIEKDLRRQKLKYSENFQEEGTQDV